MYASKSPAANSDKGGANRFFGAVHYSISSYMLYIPLSSHVHTLLEITVMARELEAVRRANSGSGKP